VLGGATLYDELTEATGFARSTVHEHLRRLKAAGLVTWEEAPAGPFGARTLQGTTRPLVRAVPFGG
jgi:DNA-binding MarR family transcriptional regulator